MGSVTMSNYVRFQFRGRGWRDLKSSNYRQASFADSNLLLTGLTWQVRDSVNPVGLQCARLDRLMGKVRGAVSYCYNFEPGC